MHVCMCTQYTNIIYVLAINQQIDLARILTITQHSNYIICTQTHILILPNSKYYVSEN